MDQKEVQKKVEDFLHELGVPGFIIFGWQKEEDDKAEKKDFSIISSFHKMPVRPAIKGLSKVLDQFIQKAL